MPIDKYDRQILLKCMPHLGENPIVFDVGACKGEYTDFVLENIPGAECYLFEPNPDAFKEIKHENKYEIALSDEGRVMKTFYKCLGKADELSSLYKREIFFTFQHLETFVQCSTIDSFCGGWVNTTQIDFLKIDVEGAEFDVLKGSKEMLNRKDITFIQVEYGGTYIDAGVKFSDVIKYVNGFGYKVYEGNTLVTLENFVEDYRYALFLLTHIDFNAS